MKETKLTITKIFNTVKFLVPVLLLAVVLAGCGAYATAPVTGFAYTEVKGPGMATSNPISSKVGTATCTSILGLIAQGDASIETAAKSAGITKIHHVDYQSKSILGLYAEFTVVVYGE
ncbi:TRL-like family protein [Candidatus Poribacteria bacterium]